ncbi:efflux transporter outer membrane subunit [Pelagicoccus sp. SDUM812003]|uniref:efflux transporter outer membrane subunit n=1 Tax=Pelagicoccus sp. SDUM812003 TaxID=3041267 RepID=UPI00280D76E1|nr:efflux transporter outer membrane subunit [Pelagicoccus sp. SDUM812003]MDQ8201865.1 efflux transporter outer membrane subunit [Pelagicoccus sp. SDUM812003]
MSRLLPNLPLLLPALFLGACFSPSQWSEKEPLPLPDSYQSGATTELEIAQSLLHLFDTPELDRVVELALENNPSLSGAMARFEEAGFLLTQTRSRLFPSLDGGASARRDDPAGFGASDTYSVSLDASWEVDVWGRLRANANASRADLAASEADFHYARQSLVAQVMQAWFSLVAAEKLTELDQRRVNSFTTTEQLVSRRFDLGEASYSELNLARTDLENAKADLESSLSLRDQRARQLNALAGQYPNASYGSRLSWPQLDRTVSPDLPSELLAARPDIQAAFARIRAADARVSVSQADLLPSLRLTGTGGRTSSELSDLKSSAFDSWNALANVSMTLFDAGNRTAAIGAARKRAEQAFFNYQSVVLNALREVENALSSEGYLESEESARLAALEAANNALDRVQREYESGLTTLLTLLETQRRVFNTERQTINLRASRLSNRVNLALALGKAF